MRVDRTWTISFEDQERDRLSYELESIALPADLGWKPVLWQIASARQITLPLRAIERLSLELDIARASFAERASAQDYKKRFPMVAELSAEVESILYCSKRKSA